MSENPAVAAGAMPAITQPASVAATNMHVVRCGPTGLQRSPFKVWGLCVITLGIYQIVHWYKINTELAAYSKAIKVNPLWAALAFLVPIAGIVTVFSTCTRVRTAQKMSGLPPECSGWGFLFANLVAAGPAYVQAKLNALWRMVGPT